MRRWIAILLLLAPFAYGYEAIDLWRMGAAARQNNVVTGGGAPPSWAPTGLLAYWDWSTNSAPANEGLSNITYSALFGPTWSNSVPGKSNGAMWFEGTNADNFAHLLTTTRYPNEGGGSTLQNFFLAVTVRPTRLTGIDDSYAAWIGLGNGSSLNGAGQLVFGSYGSTLICEEYDGANHNASQAGTIALDTWYTIIFEGVGGELRSQIYGSSTVTGGSYAGSDYTLTNLITIAGDDYRYASTYARAFRGFIRNVAIGTGLDNSEKTNLLIRMSQ